MPEPLAGYDLWKLRESSKVTGLSVEDTAALWSVMDEAADGDDGDRADEAHDEEGDR